MLSRFFRESSEISSQATTAQVHSLSLSTSLPIPGRPRASACFHAKARLMRVPENVIGGGIISRAFCPKGSGNYKDLDKTQVKLLPNFTSIPFDYLLISWVTNYVSNRGFLTCLSWIDHELHSLERLELKFGLSFQNFSTTYL